MHQIKMTKAFKHMSRSQSWTDRLTNTIVKNIVRDWRLINIVNDSGFGKDLKATFDEFCPGARE